MSFYGLETAMNLHSSKLLLCTMISFLSQTAFSADSPVDLANRENDRIQQQLQERQKFEQQQLLQASKPPARIEIAEPENTTTVIGPCLQINHVDVLGNQHISNKKYNPNI